MNIRDLYDPIEVVTEKMTYVIKALSNGNLNVPDDKLWELSDYLTDLLNEYHITVTIGCEDEND